MSNLLLIHVGIIYLGDILGRKLILVAFMNKLIAGINKTNSVVCLVFLQYQEASGNGCAKEKILWHLNDGIHKVVAYQVLAYLLLRTATIQHARELYDGSRAFGTQPTEHVHGEGKVCLAPWGEHASRRKTRVVDERGIAITIPRHGIWRVGDDGIEWLVAFMQRILQGIAVLNVEMVVVHIVQEHVHTTEVVGFHVDFLTIETILYVLGTHHTDKVQK